MNSLDQQLADRFRLHAQRRGISLATVAEKTGLSEQQVFRLLEGSTPLIEPQFIAVAIALDLKPADELRHALRAVSAKS